MQLYLIRHPEPDIAPGICYGQSDISAKTWHTDQVLNDLISVLPANIKIYSSPLQRCLDLAYALAAQLDSSAPQLDKRLMELNFGHWEMLPWSSIPRHEIDAWADAPAAFRPGGAESVEEIAVRILDFLQDLSQTAIKEAVIVTHAGCIRLLQNYKTGMSAREVALAAANQQNHLSFGQCCQLTLVENSSNDGLTQSTPG